MTSDTSKAQAASLASPEPTARELALNEFLALAGQDGSLSEDDNKRGLELLAELRADSAASRKQPRESIAGKSDRNGDSERKDKPTNASDIQGDQLRRRGY